MLINVIILINFIREKYLSLYFYLFVIYNFLEFYIILEDNFEFIVVNFLFCNV